MSINIIMETAYVVDDAIPTLTVNAGTDHRERERMKGDALLQFIHSIFFGN